MLKIPKSFQIETKNFILRSNSEEDFPSIFSATRYKGFNDGMPWDPPASEAELIESLKRARQGWEEGSGYGFTITRKTSLEFLGRISIRKTPINHRWNIGFFTHPKEQGKGIMTEAVNGILKFGFETLEAQKIEAAHAIWNKASEKVLMNNGMTFEKYLEKGFLKHGEWVEENLLSIDSKQFYSRQKQKQ